MRDEPERLVIRRLEPVDAGQNDYGGVLTAILGLKAQQANLLALGEEFGRRFVDSRGVFLGLFRAGFFRLSRCRRRARARLFRPR